MNGRFEHLSNLGALELLAVSSFFILLLAFGLIRLWVIKRNAASSATRRIMRTQLIASSVQ